MLVDVLASRLRANDMNELETLMKQLIRDEGFVPHAYKDSLGFLTIGVGRLIDVRKGGGLTREEIMYLLRNDILKHTKAVTDHLYWADPIVIGAARFAALINMHFQLGDGLWQFVNTLKFMEAGDYEEASTEVLKSTWAAQTPERAQRVAEQLRTNQWV